MPGVSTNVVNPLAGSNLTSLSAVFGLLINVVLGVGITLTVIYLIAGGIKYVTSQGDQKNTTQAREWLTNAVIGFIVIIGSFLIKLIVSGVIGANNTSINNVTPF